MAYKVRKTEHGGAKHAQGHWGTKAEAKRESSRRRRRQQRERNLGQQVEDVLFGELQ